MNASKQWFLNIDLHTDSYVHLESIAFCWDNFQDFPQINTEPVCHHRTAKAQRDIGELRLLSSYLTPSCPDPHPEVSTKATSHSDLAAKGFPPLHMFDPGGD